MTGPDDSTAWVSVLRGRRTAARGAAIERLRAHLLRATRFELARRRDQLAALAPAEVDQVATRAADAALLAVLGSLDDFRGASSFSTWTGKFALVEAAIAVRRRAWQGRDIDDQTWPPDPVLRDAVRASLTPHEREVFLAVAVNGVPIDVVCERRNTTRGALYRTLQDARSKLRVFLEKATQPVDVRVGAG
jgi:RNA polymerase sigma-70 factor (ECF subfamily)